ncbi:MAG: sugar phosphate nucleotidyltransferase [Nanoarchaeota archaeon]
MKAVIMAGGKGTRMLPLTQHTNKVLIPVLGRPFLHHLLTRLRKAGYDEFGVIVNYKRELVQEFIKREGWNATLIDQPQPLGTGDAVRCAREFVGEEDFVVVGGDNLWSTGDLQRMRIEDGYNYVMGKQHAHPELYGVLQTQGDFLTAIVEKPQHFVGDLINTGLYKFKPEIFKSLDEITPTPNGEYYLTDAVSLLAKFHKVKVLALQDYWLDFGKPQDVPLVEAFLRNHAA